MKEREETKQIKLTNSQKLFDMKKLFAIAACVGLLSVGMANVAQAQNADSTAATPATEQVDSAAATTADSAAVAADTATGESASTRESRVPGGATRRRLCRRCSCRGLGE